MIKDNSNNSEEDFVYDVSENDFVEKVIELSSTKLVVVDFWAPWCQPCKQLGPILESVINKSKGKVLLAKLNIDENQQIASQLRIQSIPTVIAFKEKKIANAFQGVLPENKIVEFLEKVLGEKLEKDNSDFYNQINDLFKNKNFENAITLLEDFIAENSNDERGIGLYVECLIGLEKLDEAKSFISSLSEEMQKVSSVKSLLTQINLKENSSKGPPLSDIESKLEKDPNNFHLVVELSEKYFSNDMIERSFDVLLDLYPKNNEKNKEKIKKIFLKYFSALGNENEHTKFYRKKLSSIIFS